MTEVDIVVAAGAPAAAWPLKVAYAGTPEFAAIALRAILAAGHTVPLVLTQPDRPAGRGLQLQPSAVKQVALERGLAVRHPRGLRLDGRFADDAVEARHALATARPDIMVVAAYGLILPAWVLALPRLGCLNIHGSMLPRWRGAAPIQRAIEAGDAATGITIIQMDAGLDTGPMLRAEPVAIESHDTAATLHDKLAAVGARLIVQAIADAAAGRATVTPQPTAGVTYAAKIDKAEAAIDWHAPAALVERRVRAFDPVPGAHFTVDGAVVKLWRARLANAAEGEQAMPGRVLNADARSITVACGSGAIELLELQRPGGRRLAVSAFQQAKALHAGTLLS